MARIFLYIFAVLVALAVFLAIGWANFGDRIMARFMVPTVPFEESPQAPPTFYDREDAWVSRPGTPDDVSAWRPVGFEDEDLEPVASVFYVHPTTYLGTDRWNAEIDPDDEGAIYRRDLFVRSQASVFNGVGEIWAPKYRQAAFGAFLALAEPDAAKAFALAYTDVANAFDVFVAAIPEDRPIILAGHSQGSLHLVSLLARRLSENGLRNRIVAAYIVGWPISIEADLPALGLPPCEDADQTGCIVSFASFSEPADPKLVLDPFALTTGMTGLQRTDEGLVCTNPLTGGAGGSAPAEDNVGSVIPESSLADGLLEPGRAGAACDERGLLLVGEDPPHEYGTYTLPGNNMHVYDYALFWANLRADAERRTARYLLSDDD